MQLEARLNPKPNPNLNPNPNPNQAECERQAALKAAAAEAAQALERTRQECAAEQVEAVRKALAEFEAQLMDE